MRHWILLAFAARAAAQPTVQQFGAVGDGITDDSAAFARAIRSLEGLGGALRIPKGAYNLGTAGVVIPNTFGGIRLIGDSATASRILYSGNGAAVQIGVPGATTYGHALSDLQIDLTQAGPDAVAVKLHPALYVSLARLYLTSNNTHPSNRQRGIVAEGGSAHDKLFGAYVRIEDARINGRFHRGIHFTATSIGWGFNSCVISGGAIVYPGPPEPGAIGVHIEQGNQNLLLMVDVEQYDIGIQSDAYANTLVSTRTEGNRVGLVLAAETSASTGGAANKIIGASHEDGLVNRSKGSEILATSHPR